MCLCGVYVCCGGSTWQSCFVGSVLGCIKENVRATQRFFHILTRYVFLCITNPNYESVHFMSKKPVKSSPSVCFRAAMFRKFSLDERLGCPGPNSRSTFSTISGVVIHALPTSIDSAVSTTNSYSDADFSTSELTQLSQTEFPS